MYDGSKLVRRRTSTKVLELEVELKVLTKEKTQGNKLTRKTLELLKVIPTPGEDAPHWILQLIIGKVLENGVEIVTARH